MSSKEKREEQRQFWSELIAGHKQSGQSVQTFCQERGVAAHCFYYWRQRLESREKPVRFALVETRVEAGAQSSSAAVELTLISGERLRIPAGTDTATLRQVLAVLREVRA